MISRSAIAMLGRQIAQDKLARARLSHAIRSDTTGDNWIYLDSTNVPVLMHRALPSVGQQLDLLIRWLASRLDEDRFGQVLLEDPENIAAVVGAVDSGRVMRLLEYAQAEKVIEHDGSGKIGLTPKGWKSIEREKHELERSPANPTQRETTTLKAHCNDCGADRNAFERASHTVKDGDDQTSWSNSYEILECCGCSTLSVRHQFWFSEWDSIDNHPLTGEPRLVPGIKTTYWPPPTTRKKPNWADTIEDESLRKVMDEVYIALNAGLSILSSIGTRTLLDRAMTLQVGDKGGFARKLDLMVEGGHIGASEREILDAMTDAGSASAHRGHSPTIEHLNAIVETMENFLHRVFVLKSTAEAVKAATPQRR